MPAYFSINFKCDKKNIDKKPVHDFCDGLMANGFSFLSGYWGYEEDSLSDILAWNQGKLEDNFQLGRTESLARDYKQILFSYGGFSEVRMFLLNSREEETFSFEVIIPEDELIRWESGRPGYDAEKMDGLVRICEKMWLRPYVVLIQTALELSDVVPSAEEIRSGAKPGVEPFTILPETLWSVQNAPHTKRRDVGKYVCRSIDRDGVVLRLTDYR